MAHIRFRIVLFIFYLSTLILEKSTLILEKSALNLEISTLKSILPRLKSIFPSLKSIFPSLKSIFPSLKSILPWLKSIFPSLKSIFPSLKSIFPRLKSTNRKFKKHGVARIRFRRYRSMYDGYQFGLLAYIWRVEDVSKTALNILFVNLIIARMKASGHFQDASMLQVHLQTPWGLVFGGLFVVLWTCDVLKTLPRDL